MFRQGKEKPKGNPWAPNHLATQPSPRKDKASRTQEAAAKTPDKTNDWEMHGDGDTIDLQPRPEGSLGAPFVSL